jgi:trk system potassium uptake protein TrkH
MLCKMRPEMSNEGDGPNPMLAPARASPVVLRASVPPRRSQPPDALAPPHPAASLRGARGGIRLDWALFGALLLLLLLDFGWPMRRGFSHAVLGALTVLGVPWAWLVLRSAGSAGALLQAWSFRLLILAIGGLLLGAKWWLLLGTSSADLAHFVGSSRSYAVALFLVVSLGCIAGGVRLARFGALVADHPARLIALSFGGTGLLGGLLLSLPMSLQRVHELSLLDNLFMSFSAVCVTGLSVSLLSDTYTLFGQAILCLLIQIGGLGIMVFSAAIAVLTGQHMRVKSSAMFAEMVDAESLAQLRRVVVGIVASTFIIEALAASVLYLELSARPELLISNASPVVRGSTVVWAAIFHAVSAFCNAGLSNLPSGLSPFVGEVSVIGTVSLLIILGGIGFPVIYELSFRFSRWVLRRRQQRMSLHSRIALIASALLSAGTTLAYLMLEWTGAFAELGWFERVSVAIFQAVSCRSAGFNVIDVAAMRPASLMLTCVAMFIGASPGSCGGGIKTTTLAVLFAGVRSELQGRPAYLLDRALSSGTIRKATGVLFLSLGILTVLSFLLLLSERQPPLDLAFEVFSAFSTTGLSTGVTPRLSDIGKALVLCTMYIGRIGPLTLALAVSARTQQPRVQFPTERVLIG